MNEHRTIEKKLTAEIRRGLRWIEAQAGADFETQDTDECPELKGRRREEVIAAFSWLRHIAYGNNLVRYE